MLHAAIDAWGKGILIFFHLLIVWQLVNCWRHSLSRPILDEDFKKMSPILLTTFSRSKVTVIYYIGMVFPEEHITTIIVLWPAPLKMPVYYHEIDLQR